MILQSYVPIGDLHRQNVILLQLFHILRNEILFYFVSFLLYVTSIQDKHAMTTRWISC